jgi:hypothetical protein
VEIGQFYYPARLIERTVENNWIVVFWSGCQFDESIQNPPKVGDRVTVPEYTITDEMWGNWRSRRKIRVLLVATCTSSR